MLCLDTEQEEAKREQIQKDVNMRRIGNTDIILNKNDIEESADDILMTFEDNEDKKDKKEEKQDDDDDDEEDEDEDVDFDALRSIVTSPINIKSLESLSFEHRTKSKRKKDAIGKTNGIFSSFWNIREKLTNSRINGFNALNGLK